MVFPWVRVVNTVFLWEVDVFAATCHQKCSLESPTTGMRGSSVHFLVPSASVIDARCMRVRAMLLRLSVLIPASFLLPFSSAGCRNSSIRGLFVFVLVLVLPHLLV